MFSSPQNIKQTNSVFTFIENDNQFLNVFEKSFQRSPSQKTLSVKENNVMF
jgi:hypothetical protein